MPLIHSKSPKAVGSNIKAELNAGKPRAQAIAIALSTQRAAHKAHGGMMKKMNDDDMKMLAHAVMKKMASGGMVEGDPGTEIEDPENDFLSDEEDDSHMLSDNEDFLSDEDDGEASKPLLSSIMDRMKYKRMMRKA